VTTHHELEHELAPRKPKLGDDVAPAFARLRAAMRAHVATIAPASSSSPTGAELDELARALRAHYQ
jgi:hypothetical protein